MVIEPRDAAGSIVTFADPDATAATIIVEETGRELEYRLAQNESWRPIDSRPPRLGLLALEHRAGTSIALRSVDRSGPSTTALVRLACGATDPDALLSRCVVDGDSTAVAGTRGGAVVAEGSRCRALRIHHAAASASARGENSRAADLYAEAAAEWARLGDARREGAAWLGATEVLVRLGRFDNAEFATQVAAERSRAGGNPFFALRAESERCLVMRYRGDGAAALHCLEPLAARYLQLDEVNEAANTYVSTAGIAFDERRYAMVAQALAPATALDRSRLRPAVRARLAQFEAQWHLHFGRIPEALERFDRALSEIQATGDRRWQANVLLKVAALNHDLGAYEEATAFVETALILLDRNAAPTRVAEALLMRARLRSDLAQREAAIADAREAEQLFGEHEMPRESETARVLAERLRLDLEPASARDVFPGTSKAGGAPGSDPESALFDLRRAQLRGDWQSAASVYDRMEPLPLSISDRMRLLRAMIVTEIARGDPARARRRIERAAAGLRRIAQKAAAPALRHLVGRRLLELRTLWVDVFHATPAKTQPNPERVWQFVALTDPLPLVIGTQSIKDESQTRSGEATHDVALAATLLAQVDPLHRTEAQLTVLRHLAAAGPIESDPAPVAQELALASLQARLSPDSTALFLLPGTHAGLGIEVRANDAGLYPIAPSAAVARALASLRAAANPARHLLEFESAAAALSRMLLPPGGPRPERLVAYLDPSLAGVPLSALTWPGDGNPLVDVSVVSLLASANPNQPSDPALPVEHVTTLIGSFNADNDAALAPLFGAMQEPRLIRSSLEPAARDGVDSAISRAALEHALATPDAWVHIASHGISRRGSIGLSGLWIPARTSQSKAEFVSWISLLDAPIRARTVILSACDLADGPSASTPTLTVASALAAGGASNVVAALWSVSDSASTAFTHEFYGNVRSHDAHGVAAALRHGQRRLRNSRGFRHPFYWASLVHLQR
jgi:tetratricopeptide (TPR) repeat protein